MKTEKEIVADIVGMIRAENPVEAEARLPKDLQEAQRYCVVATSIIDMLTDVPGGLEAVVEFGEKAIDGDEWTFKPEEWT